jgi:ER lumen protein retaining receptor
MVSKTGEAETITSHYLFALGIYRFLYILNWIYRYYTEHFIDWISIISGVVQTVLYCDFFYLYITKGYLLFCKTNYLISLSFIVLKGKKLSLPA